MLETATRAFRFLPAPDRTRFLFRGRDAARQAVAAALGITAPDALRAASNGSTDALWLGPDEWLLLGADPDADLAEALSGIAHSLVDIGDRQLGFEASGANLLPVLNAGCPLDLSRAAFPVGMCTRTLLAKSEIVLWRRADNVFHIEVARSLAPYLSAYLAEVARSVGEDITA